MSNQIDQVARIAELDSELRKSIVPLFVEAGKKLRCPIASDTVLFGSFEGGALGHTVVESFDKLTVGDLAQGVDLGIVYADLPRDYLDERYSIPTGFYRMHIKETSASLLDVNGDQVASDLPLAIGPGEPDVFARRELDILVQKKKFKFSYHGPRLSIEVTIGK